MAVGCLAAQVGSGLLLLYIVVTQRLADGEGRSVFLKPAAAAGLVIGGCIGAIRSGDEILTFRFFQVVLMDMRLLFFADVPADGAVFCGLLGGGGDIPGMVFAVIFGIAEGADMIMLAFIGVLRQIVSGEAVRADCLALEIEVANMGKSFVGGSAADRTGFPVGIVGLAVGGFGSQILGVFQINKCMLRIIAEFRAALVADCFLGAGGGGGGTVFLGRAAVIVAADGAALLVAIGVGDRDIAIFVKLGAEDFVTVGANLDVAQLVFAQFVFVFAGVVADPVDINVMGSGIAYKAADRFGKGRFAAFIKVACHVLSGFFRIGAGFEIQLGIADGDGIRIYCRIAGVAVIGDLERGIDGKVHSITGNAIAASGVAADCHWNINSHILIRGQIYSMSTFGSQREGTGSFKDKTCHGINGVKAIAIHSNRAITGDIDGQGVGELTDLVIAAELQHTIITSGLEVVEIQGMCGGIVIDAPLGAIGGGNNIGHGRIEHITLIALNSCIFILNGRCYLAVGEGVSGIFLGSAAHAAAVIVGGGGGKGRLFCQIASLRNLPVVDMYFGICCGFEVNAGVIGAKSTARPFGGFIFAGRQAIGFGNVIRRSILRIALAASPRHMPPATF